MNFLSRFKKIFLIAFLVFMLCGSTMFAEVNIVGDRAYKVPNLYITGERYEGDGGGGGDDDVFVQDTVDLYNADVSNGTQSVWSFSRFREQGLREAYKAAGVDFDTHTNIDMSKVYINKTSAAVSYIEQGTSKIVAISTPAGTFIPRGIAIKDQLSGRRFFNVVDTASGYSAGTDNRPGTVEDAYIHNDTSDENREDQIQEQEDINSRVDSLRATVAQDQKNLDALIARRASAAEIEAARAKLQTSADALRRGEAEKARQDGIVSGLETPTECDIWNFYTFKCILKGLSFIALIVFKLASFVLGLAGSLLDYSIELSVNSAEFLESLNIVNPMWTFVRDILNMSFIFILLWIAINMVLGRAGVGSAKTYTIKNDVRNVVLVAILINFSLFFAKLFVDGSNLVILELYQHMKPEKTNIGDGQSGISDQIMNTVGLTSLVNIGELFTTSTKEFPPACQAVPEITLSVGIFGTIFVLILAVAFGLAAVLFFIRLPNMIYLFISSPTWIWGYVMKGGIFDKARTSWAQNMFHLCTFPIVYMMWMLIGVFTFKQLLGAKKEGGTFLDLLCKNTDSGIFTQSLSVILIFCIVITVMMKAIKYAMDKGAGTSFVAPLANKFIARAGKLQTSMTTGLYNKAQNTVTGAANKVGAAGLAVAGGVGKIAAAPFIGAKNIAVSGVRSGVSKTSNAIADMFGAGAARVPTPLLQKMLSGTSNKFRDPKIFGQTQKEHLDARQKKAEENRAKYQKSLKDSGVFKIESKDDWIERTGKTEADYDKYVEDKAKLIMRSQLGDQVMNYKKAGGVKTNEEEILSDMFETIKDPKTGVEKKKFNQGKLWRSIVEKQAYHTTGDGKKDLALTSTQSKFFDPDKRRAKGRIDANNKFARAQSNEADQKERKKAELKRKKDLIAKLEEELVYMPVSQADLERAVTSPEFDKGKHTITVKKYKSEMKKLEMLENQRDADPELKRRVEEEMIKLANKVDTERMKLQDQIEKHKKTIDKIQEEMENKK